MTDDIDRKIELAERVIPKVIAAIRSQMLAEVRQAVQPALDIAREQAERINQALDDYPAYSSAEDAIQEAEAALTEGSE